MTTYAGFVSTISGLTITGVVTQLDHIPEIEDTADLPASFVRLPGGGINTETLTTCSGSGKSRTIELVVLIKPIPQSTASSNFAATVTMMDSIETALDANRTSIMPFVTYDISAGPEDVGGTGFWAVTATITGEE